MLGLRAELDPWKYPTCYPEYLDYISQVQDREKILRDKAEQERAAHLRDEMSTQAYLHDLHEKKAKIKLASNY